MTKVMGGVRADEQDEQGEEQDEQGEEGEEQGQKRAKVTPILPTRPCLRCKHMHLATSVRHSQALSNL